MHQPRLIALCLFVALMISAATGASLGRDTDGSRMQARPISVGSTDNDQLSPPGDAVDWRYFRLSDARDLTISASSEPVSVRLDVTITDAVGKTIARGKTSKKTGKFQTRRRFDPGLYYVSVSSSGSTSYQISVQ